MHTGVLLALFAAGKALTGIENPGKMCLEWLDSLPDGYVHDNVRVSEFEGMGLGMEVHGRAIDNNSVILSIHSDVCPLLLPNTYESDSDILNDMACQLAAARAEGPSSHLAGLLKSLPDNSNYIPATWDEDKLLSIKGTTIYRDALSMRSQFSESMEAVKGKADEGELPYSADDWLWALVCCQSRGFIFFDGTAAMVPGVALCNHHDDIKRCAAVTKGNGITFPESSFTITSCQKLYPGEHIFISYGELSLQQKALSFGWLDFPVLGRQHCALPRNGLRHR